MKRVSDKSIKTLHPVESANTEGAHELGVSDAAQVVTEYENTVGYERSASSRREKRNSEELGAPSQLLLLIFSGV